jgi:hypothetical protein
MDKISDQGTYRVTEDRFTDTGQKYASVHLDESGICNYRIIFAGNGIVKLRCGVSVTSISKGDVSPWD